MIRRSVKVARARQSVMMLEVAVQRFIPQQFANFPCLASVAIRPASQQLLRVTALPARPTAEFPRWGG